MNSGPTLQIGSTGPDVRRLQILFVMTKLLDYTGIDGSFGPQTHDAVKSFQQSSNLTADGVVGQATWNALPADPNTPRLARGSTGSVVSALQKALATFGGANTPTDPGPIDGDFGPRTESAVRAYQTQQNIVVRWRGWRSDMVGAGRRSRCYAGVVSRPRYGLNPLPASLVVACQAPPCPVTLPISPVTLPISSEGTGQNIDEPTRPPPPYPRIALK